MPQREADRLLRQSVLDRLAGGAEPEPRTRSESLRRYRDAVRRDLEWLLNSRRIAEPAPARYRELGASVYHYGLPDITSMSERSQATSRLLIRHIEETIEQFEPRLSSVRVQEVEAKGASGREVHFVVEALLRLDPEPERIVFDTVMERGSGNFSVAGGENA